MRQTTMDRLKTLTAISILMISITVLSGCWGIRQPFTQTQFIYPRQPVYEVPKSAPLKNVPAEEMQKLSSEAREIIVGNFNILTGHVRALEAIVETHNNYAKALNEQSGVYGGNAVTPVRPKDDK